VRRVAFCCHAPLPGAIFQRGAQMTRPFPIPADFENERGIKHLVRATSAFLRAHSGGCRAGRHLRV